MELQSRDADAHVCLFNVFESALSETAILEPPRRARLRMHNVALSCQNNTTHAHTPTCSRRTWRENQKQDCMHVHAITCTQETNKEKRQRASCQALTLGVLSTLEFCDTKPPKPKHSPSASTHVRAGGSMDSGLHTTLQITLRCRAR